MRTTNQLLYPKILKGAVSDMPTRIYKKTHKQKHARVMRGESRGLLQIAMQEHPSPPPVSSPALRVDPYFHTKNSLLLRIQHYTSDLALTPSSLVNHGQDVKDASATITIGVPWVHREDHEIRLRTCSQSLIFRTAGLSDNPPFPSFPQPLGRRIIPAV